MPLLVLTLLILHSPLFGASSHSPLLAGGQGGVFWIANEGQWEGDFQFKCEVGSTIYYVTPQGMTVDFRQIVGAAGVPPVLGRFDPFERKRDPVTVRGHVVQIHYSGLPPFSSAEMGGLRGASVENKLPHYSNYFLGRDSTKWRSRVSHYTNIIVPEVWPGIDVEYRADNLGVETIYHVKPGADPTQIQMEYLGLDAPLRVDSQGNLILTTSLGDVKEQAPFAFQQEGGTQKRVSATFRISNSNIGAYSIGEFDNNKVLIIDPVLYSSYFGSGYGIKGITTLLSGGIAITSEVESYEFPVSPGAYQDSIAGRSDVMICGLSDDGTEFQFFTYLGGEHYDMPYGGICQSNDGNLFVAGLTHSTAWPLTPDAYDTTRSLTNRTLFFAGISPDGTELIYSSFISGPSDNNMNYIDVADETGDILLCGDTFDSDEFPTTPSALYRDASDTEVSAFVAVFDPDLLEFSYVTLFPALEGSTSAVTAWSIVEGEEGTVWISGDVYEGCVIPVTDNAIQGLYGGGRGDGFFACIDYRSSELLYSSYFGGSLYDVCDVLYLPNSRIILGGTTYSADLPVTPNALDSQPDVLGFGDGFWAAIALPDTILTCSYIGGDSTSDLLTRPVIDPEGRVVFSGFTFGPRFPITPNAADSTWNGGIDWIMLRASPNLDSILYATYWGGESDDLIGNFRPVIDHDGYVWMGGENYLCGFTVTNNALYPNCTGFYNNILARFDLGSGGTDISEESRAIPQEFTLSAFPNPFNPTTTLSFSLPHLTNVALKIHNILGREVERVELGQMTAGQHEFTINGDAWASGIYFATLETPVFSRTQKLLLLR